MAGISIWSLLLIFAIILLLFGTKKLRNIGSDLGGAIKNFKKSIDELKYRMDMFSKQLQYEEAKEIKDKLDILYNYQAKSTIVNSKISDIDVFVRHSFHSP